MATFAELLEETARAARERRWQAYRLRFGALREALGAASGADEELAARLDVLHAAAPEQDPEGYLSEVEALLALLDEKGLARSAAPAPSPALDLRGLPPPEPIVCILDTLARSPREPLRVVLPHEPVPLYALLRERGFTWSGAERADGAYELLIEAS
jgi:uncharacterized protein (DUF2249 family)